MMNKKTANRVVQLITWASEHANAELGSGDPYTVKSALEEVINFGSEAQILEFNRHDDLFKIYDEWVKTKDLDPEEDNWAAFMTEVVQAADKIGKTSAKKRKTIAKKRKTSVKKGKTSAKKSPKKASPAKRLPNTIKSLRGKKITPRPPGSGKYRSIYKNCPDIYRKDVCLHKPTRVKRSCMWDISQPKGQRCYAVAQQQ